jgi:putative ABC transport system permease protein
LVAVVIITLVIYTFTLEKIRSIAIMKLIGAPTRLIVRLVMEQSLLLTALSFGFGWLVVSNTYHLWPKRVLLVPGDTLTVLAVVLAGGLLASLLGLWRALKTEPAMALGGQ